MSTVTLRVRRQHVKFDYLKKVWECCNNSSAQKFQKCKTVWFMSYCLLVIIPVLLTFSTDLNVIVATQGIRDFLPKLL